MKANLLLASWLLAGATLSGCAARHQAVHPAEYREPIRVACVGDSITWGAGVEDREQNNYPTVLGHLLGDKFVTRNFGVSGATLLKHGDLPYWDQPAFRAVAEFRPHVVVLKLGTNDSKPQNWRFKSEFEADLRAMIGHFKNLPDHPKIWVCYPAPVYAPRWGINEPVVRDEIIPIIQRVAAAEGVAPVDLHHALANRPEYFPDQIHPNAMGAALLAQAVAIALEGRYP